MSKASPVTAIVEYPPKRDPSRPLDPPTELLALQRERPIARVRIWDGSEPWLVTRYEDGRFVLGDSRFSADPTRPGFPEKSAAYAATIGQDRNMRTLDNPEHDVHKRMMIRDFAVRRVEAMRPKIQARVDELIDGMTASPERPVDFMQAFALPLPTGVVCDVIGVPFEDESFFAGRVAACISAKFTPEESAQAGEELYDYFDGLVEVKLATPADDLLSRLVHEQLTQGTLAREELVTMARFLLIAGYETTAHMIGLGVLVLLDHPDQLAEMCSSNDPNLIVNAVDELLRYLSIVHTGRRRVAVEDVVVAGQLVKAGEGVIVANNVADRDESVFPDAHRFDIHRPNARLNMAFGHGIHLCIGQLLSRVEQQVVHATLWKRIPTLRLAVPREELVFDESASVFGIESLPVTW